VNSLSGQSLCGVLRFAGPQSALGFVFDGQNFMEWLQKRPIGGGMVERVDGKTDLHGQPDLIWKLMRGPLFMFTLVMLAFIYLVVYGVVSLTVSPMVMGAWSGVVVFVMGLLLPVLPILIAPYWRPAIVGLILVGVVLLPWYIVPKLNPWHDMAPVGRMLSPSIAGVLLAGFCWVVFWVSRRRPWSAPICRAGRSAALFASACFLVWIALLCRLAVCNETPDTLPTDASPALIEAAKNPDARFHYFAVAAFFHNRVTIWRLDAPGSVLERMIEEMGLKAMSKGDLPLDFWRMPACFWPGSFPDGARVYSQTSDGRPQKEVILVYDLEKSRVYVRERMSPD
jgi:hypothetical protein